MAIDPIIALRARAKETYDIALGGAIKHMLVAESVGEMAVKEGGPIDDEAMNRHIRMAEVYAQIAQACQKIPGQQF